MSYCSVVELIIVPPTYTADLRVAVKRLGYSMLNDDSLSGEYIQSTIQPLWQSSSVSARKASPTNEGAPSKRRAEPDSEGYDLIPQSGPVHARLH